MASVDTLSHIGFHIVHPHITLEAMSAKIVIKRSVMTVNARRTNATASMNIPFWLKDTHSLTLIVLIVIRCQETCTPFVIGNLELELFHVDGSVHDPALVHQGCHRVRHDRRKHLVNGLL